MTNQFDAQVNEGTYLISLGDAGMAQRDQYAKTWLTKKGQEIFSTIGPRDTNIRERVSRAVEAGY